ncbi:hypothetical protein J437_LFUL006671 [Ladona fulva]|uniref:Multidrug resistance-associated protein lethal(2)03659 n=1 Tax=Ladona fulva TaxID=123851 RepID=A0A8K0K6S0_LADFU|nr:hypothetical protein J437_LFUL006671 [Ladona fulva]
MDATDAKDKKERKENPRSTANTFSLAFFWWVIELFKLGYKKPIIEEDLFKPVPDDNSDYLGALLEKNWNRQLKKCKSLNKTPSLFMAILRTFGPTYFTFGIMLSLNELGVRIVQPVFLGKMLSYFHVESTMERSEALLYAAGIVICSGINCLFANHYILEAFRIGMRVRIACCSLIYRKSLRLSSTALGETAIGKIVNLLSNDVARFDIVAITINYLWISPLAAILVAYMVYQHIGIAGIIGIAVVFIIVPLQSWTGKLSSIFRTRSAVRTDERVRLMDEIVRGIRVIKMYAWEMPFARLIAEARRTEIDVLRKVSFIRGLYMTFNLFTSRMALFCAIAAYVSFGNIVSADKVFVVSSYFIILSFTMSGIFVRGVAEVAEANVSIGRLQKFLLLDEFTNNTTAHKDLSSNGTVDQFNSLKSKNMTHELKEKKAIIMDKVCAKWNVASSDNTLSNISMAVERGKVIGVIGTVGAGKSSLLQALLGEIPLTSGFLNLNGRVGYASQEPWVFGGTIRQNILFGAPYDEKRYRRVTSACALRRDFQQLPRGDLTHVGDRGSLLSGGQKARVNLARAVYAKPDILLLDDPLSAVDAHVGKHLVDHCIMGNMLHGTTIILATHQIQHLHMTDEIIVLEEGCIKARGTYEELMGATENEDDEVDEGGRRKSIGGLMRHLSQMSGTSKRSSVGGESTKDEKEEDEPEQGKKGSVDGKVYMRYLTSATHPLALLGLGILFVMTQVAASGVDYFVSFWAKQEELRIVHTLLNDSATPNLTSQEFKERSIIAEFNEDQPVLLSQEWLLGLYGATVASLFIISITRSIFFSITCMRCSTSLHNSMFQAVVQAPMHFFDANPSARSPVYTHIGATLEGLSTIRSHSAQTILIKEFDQIQDINTSAYFMYLSVSSGFGFILDIMCILYVSIVTFSFIFLEQDALGGNVGLAITQSMMLAGMFQWGVRQTAEVENQMTSVERILEYSDLEKEETLDEKRERKPKDKWPTKGEIKYNSVGMSYKEGGPLVIRHLSFTISPSEKVGIVGRTGAGKSSLIASILRLGCIEEGTVCIDDVNICSIGLQELRSSISVIPQDPVLFSGTLRSNLDPFQEYTDDLIWRALEDVELKEVASETAGLETRILAGGTNLSVGQRQLLCLARAILRQNKILLLDEATANVDPKTDSLIQSTIRHKFATCSVITVAHRLNTIMDYDKVLVMSAGRMVEFNHPYILLQNDDGFLFKMVKKTGYHMAETLTQIAEEAYRKHTSNLRQEQQAEDETTDL